MKGLLKTRPSGFITPNLQLGNQLIRTTPLEIEFISLFYSLNYIANYIMQRGSKTDEKSLDYQT